MAKGSPPLLLKLVSVRPAWFYNTWQHIAQKEVKEGIGRQKFCDHLRMSSLSSGQKKAREHTAVSPFFLAQCIALSLIHYVRGSD